MLVERRLSSCEFVRCYDEERLLRALMLPSFLGGFEADGGPTAFAFVVSEDCLPRSMISACVALKALKVFLIFLMKLTSSFFSPSVLVSRSSYAGA